MPHLNQRTAALGLLAAAAVLAAVLLGGCAAKSSDNGGTSTGAGGGGASAHTPTMSELTGAPWVSDHLTSPDHQLVTGSTINLTFQADSVSANAGCNTMNGGASISGSTLVVTTLASTMMGCEEALAQQDHWLQGFLTSKPTIELVGEDLRLTQGSTELQLTRHQ